MRSNYHTHTRWCRHGTGEIEDYAKYAVKLGLVELAITEHVPLPGDPDRVRMLSREFSAYDADLNRVVAGYSKKIRIRKGFECEYYPWMLDTYRAYKERFGYEILILGQHMNSARTFDNFHVTEPWQLAIYAREICAGLKSGLFDILAHPDVVMSGYREADASMLEAMDRIFSTCKEYNIPAEINGKGIINKRGYPNREIWKLARDRGISCIINSDAHHVEELEGAHLTEAENLAKELGLKLITKLP
jgi:HisJ family histidinol phosphate phosphatase